MSELINLDKFKWEQRKRAFMNWCQDRIEWIEDHPNESLAIGSGLLFGLRTVSKSMKQHNDHKEEMARRRDIYDHSTGMYLHLKRQMRADEVLKYEERLNRGERKATILADMGLLKR